MIFVEKSFHSSHLHKNNLVDSNKIIMLKRRVFKNLNSKKKVILRMKRREFKKPDPETQKLILNNIPSETIHFLEKLTMFHVINLNDGDMYAYDALNKKQKKLAITEYFTKMVYGVSLDVLEKDGYEIAKRVYQERQQFFKDQEQEYQNGLIHK